MFDTVIGRPVPMGFAAAAVEEAARRGWRNALLGLGALAIGFALLVILWLM